MFPRGLRVLIKLFVVAYCAMILDGVLLRDPCVRFSHGYVICATSWGLPCSLGYEPWEDRRPYSGWKAYHSHSYGPFFLENKTTQETLDFFSEAEWRAAVREKKAQLAEPYGPEVSGITEFGNRGPFVFGNCDQGYFILDIDKNEYHISPKEDWVQQITAKTGSPPGRMKSPTSWLVQSRDAVYYLVMGGFTAMALAWVLIPLWLSRPRKTEQTAQVSCVLDVRTNQK